jgi:2,3-dihydroxybiphenyl 1,2-dioxygenase
MTAGAMAPCNSEFTYQLQYDKPSQNSREAVMALQTLGYVGIRAKDLDDWTTYGTRFLGMQLVDKSRSTLALRMDDRKQRVIVQAEGAEGPAFFGWEVADAAPLDALAAHLEQCSVKVARGSRALAEERRVKDLIVFHDPAGNRLEAFHGAEVAQEPFKPGRSISGFRTGPLGMGHAVLTAERNDAVVPFYTDILGFRLSDYFVRPFKAYFFHINPRHHSIAFIETGTNGIHHLMVELCFLDDVGQAYDLALRKPGMIGTTLGRHTNDQVTSFYSWSPSKFLVEYGWGGRTIDPESWTPQERSDGPSLWGHDRMWLPPEKREEARDLRISVAEAGGRVPLNVMDGNYLRARDVCPWWNAVTARKTA